ncbi:preprotein translocase subunit SECE1 [Neltuma alba]|uniref:preprotein translocase subunit SECE1 n=1 Tax=Neltuma alba TaxID=207710 RepID=UPI0010A343F2|nr:preprotein translocase subunit SECE1 [Prosopis alba]
MTLHAFRPLAALSPLQTPTRPIFLNTDLLLPNPPFLPHRSRPIGITVLSEPRRGLMPVVRVVEESQESSEPEPSSASQTLPESAEQKPPTSQPDPADKNVELSELASELKKAMQDRKEKEGENLWSGVAEEIREIEWPAFGKVLGTTGVVLGVILGSSVVLLTVNAILAELSDRVFAGRGVQDFFS